VSSGSYVKVLRVNCYGSLLLLRYKAQESLSFDGRVSEIFEGELLQNDCSILAIKFEMSP